MTNKLNFYPGRSVKETSDRLVRPAFARDPNTTFNTEMSFTGRVAWHASPLTAVLNHVLNHVLRRTQRQSRSYAHICAVLLTGMFALVLAGCGGGSGSGGGGGGGGGSGDGRPVSKVQATATGNNITVSWTNPDRENITGFTIAYVNLKGTAAGEAGKTEEFNPPLANVTAGADNTYPITNLNYAATYKITVTVHYGDQGPVNLDSVEVMTGKDPADIADPGVPPPVTPPPDPLAFFDIDEATGIGNTITVRWTTPNREGITGFNITWINIGDDAKATDRGNIVLTDSLADLAAGAPHNTYTIPDLTYAATYQITVTVLYAGQDPAASDPIQRLGRTEPDPDDIDGDGVVNEDDNCQSVKNPDQLNSDTDALGDACDPDDDNDGTLDTADVDDNNNSLIEIHNLNQLALLRGDLDGNGDDDDENDGIAAVGTDGCPPPDGCIGYELTRSLNFSDAASYADGMINADWTSASDSGWVPIGSCTGSGVTSFVCAAYTGVFDGRNWTLADLFISADDAVNGVGLFAALTGGIQNLHLRNVRVSGGRFNVGGLVGFGSEGRFENLSITGGSVKSSSSAGIVGGLIGLGTDSVIRYASVSGGSVSGGSSVGGLMGRGQGADVLYAGVSGVNVNGTGSNIGGLVGDGASAEIRYAYVSDGSVAGNDRVGGLIGFGGVNAVYHYVYVSDVSVSGTVNFVGGLVGSGTTIDIRYAYVLGGSVAGSGNIGGLVGDGAFSQIDFSYAAGQVLGSGNSIGGLLGIIDHRTTVNASYWDTDTTGQPMSAGDDLGEGRSTTDLQSPTDFMGIYEDWGGIWCHPDTGAESSADTRPAGFESVWDLGTSSQYPVLNCLPVSAEQQQEQQRQQ